MNTDIKFDNVEISNNEANATGGGIYALFE